MTSRKKASKEHSFEQAVQRLEEIVESLETGSVSLEDSLALYEEGLKLSRECAEKLKAAELRIRKLSHQAPPAVEEDDE